MSPPQHVGLPDLDSGNRLRGHPRPLGPCGIPRPHRLHLGPPHSGFSHPSPPRQPRLPTPSDSRRSRQQAHPHLHCQLQYGSPTNLRTSNERDAAGASAAFTLATPYLLVLRSASLLSANALGSRARQARGLWDCARGPSRRYRSRHALLEWVNRAERKHSRRAQRDIACGTPDVGAACALGDEEGSPHSWVRMVTLLVRERLAWRLCTARRGILGAVAADGVPDDTQPCGQVLASLDVEGCSRRARPWCIGGIAGCVMAGSIDSELLRDVVDKCWLREMSGLAFSKRFVKLAM